jgi:hypothetical protein
MKTIIAVIVLVCITTISHTQTYQIRTVNKGNGVIGVEMRASSGAAPTTNNYVTDIVFGLKWLSSYNINLSDAITTNYNIKKSDVEKQKGVYEYQAFYADFIPFKFPQNWQPNVWVEIMSIGNSQTGTGTGTFEIAEPGFDITTDPNFGVDLVDKTPVINGKAECVLISQATLSNTTDYFRTVTSGNWNSACTWESSTDNTSWHAATLLPDFSAKSITILNGYTITVTSNATADNTTINSGGALVINSGDTMNIVDGTGFDLTVNGSLTVNSGGGLIIKSTSAGTASIGPSTGTITGNITVERFISSAGNRAYRLLAPSVNTTTSIRANWQENGNTIAGYGTHITGSTSGANGFDATITGQPSLYLYNQSTTAWDVISNTNVNTLNAKTGYLLYIRGDRTIDLNSVSVPLPSNNTTLRTTGTVLTGTQTFSGLAGNNGFSLITNPYPSAINWASIYAASTGLTQFYTYWDPNMGTRGAYVTVKTDGTKSNPLANADVNIQSGQAFFVQASGATGPVVSIQETDKTSVNNIDVFRTGTENETFATALYFRDANGTRRIADGVMSVYNNSYSNALDGDDAEQIANWDEDIAIARSGKMISIESRPIINSADTIFLNIAKLNVQNYEWQFSPSNFNHPNLQATLIDKYLNTRTILSLTGVSVVPFTVTSDAASSAPDRFMVVFGPASALPVTLTSVKAYQKAAGIQVDWTVLTEIDISRYEVEKSINGQEFIKAGMVPAKGSIATSIDYNWYDANPVAGNNYYRIKSINKSDEVKYSTVVKVNIGNTSGAVRIYPNPVNGNVIMIEMNNLKKGRYTVSLYNKAGQKVTGKIIDHAGGSITQSMALESNLPAGTYQVKINGEGKVFVQQLLKN